TIHRGRRPVPATDTRDGFRAVLVFRDDVLGRLDNRSGLVRHVRIHRTPVGPAPERMGPDAGSDGKPDTQAARVSLRFARGRIATVSEKCLMSKARPRGLRRVYGARRL